MFTAYWWVMNIRCFLLLYFVVITSSISYFPAIEIAYNELVTESIYLLTCLVTLYYIRILNTAAINFGWAIFCLGLTLDVCDEVVDYSELIGRTTEDWLMMIGITTFAFGFRRMASQLQEMVIDEQNKSEQLECLVNFDQLTGLYNRSHLLQVLNTKCFAASNNKNFSIIFIDLDKFKLANDKYGHDIGDMLLQAVAKRLSAIIREQDIVARWGGDEFVILYNDYTGNKDIESFVSRVSRTFNGLFNVKEHHIALGSSIGYSVFPKDSLIPEELIQKADMAMYQSKQDKAGPVRFNS